MEKQPLISCSYRIPKEIYQRFNLALTMEHYQKNVKRTTRQGVVELLVAIAVTGWVISRPQRPQIVILLCVALMGLGLYSLTFYRYIFPHSIFKTAGERYEKSAYLQGEVTLEWWEDRLVERSQEQCNEFPYTGLSRVRDGADYAALELGRERTLLLPWEMLGDQEEAARRQLDQVVLQYDIKREPLA